MEKQNEIDCISYFETQSSAARIDLKRHWDVEKMAGQLRELLALAEDPSSVPSTTHSH